MTLTTTGLMGALIFLIIGLIELAIFNRAVYPTLSARHERLKVTQEQGRDPRVIAEAVWFVSLIVMPIAGFIAGNLYASTQGAS